MQRAVKLHTGNIKKHYNHNFDKLVLGFSVINGDKGEKEAIIKLSADQLGLQKFEMTTVGNWDMLAAYVNCGFPAYAGEDYPNLYTQQKAQGVLGAFPNLKKQALREQNLPLASADGL